MAGSASISIFQLFGATIHTREASGILMQAIKESSGDKIELDFTQVTYISRSFADQFYIDKLLVAKETKKVIVVANADYAVLKMLQAVAKTQKHIRHNTSDIPIYKLKSFSQIENFLLDR
ncbi:MAG TPA: hypothetical protein VL093_07010 [Flavipsychrobacter sp.]|nr:hypothetical protein [Flavipsychrobacter sp.]